MATKTTQAAEAVTAAVTQAVKGPMFKKRLGNKQIFLYGLLSPIPYPLPSYSSFLFP
jgi:hypothetical protein